MKVVKSKQLTSSEELNKLLVAQVKCDVSFMKYVHDLHLIKEIDDDDFDIVVTHYDLEKSVLSRPDKIKQILVRHGYSLDKLVNDKSHVIRMLIANQHHYLEKLLFDPDERVRNEVLRILSEHQFTITLLNRKE